MAPILLEWGSFTLPTYGVMVVLASLVGVAWASSAARSAGLTDLELMEAALVSLGTALLAARLALWGVAWLGTANPAGAGPWRSAGYFQAGLAGGVAALAVWLRLRRFAVLRTLDALAPSLPLGAAIGRLGCLAAGCCHGRPTGLAWAVTYLDPRARELGGVPLGVGLHPAPLYFAAASLVQFLVLVRPARSEPGSGRVLWGLLLLEGLSRLLLGPFRGDLDARLGPVAPGTLLGAGLVVTGAAGLARARGSG